MFLRPNREVMVTVFSLPAPPLPQANKVVSLQIDQVQGVAYTFELKLEPELYIVPGMPCLGSFAIAEESTYR